MTGYLRLVSDLLDRHTTINLLETQPGDCCELPIPHYHDPGILDSRDEKRPVEHESKEHS